MNDTGEHDFLGEEFLTWLWFRLETHGGDFEIDRRHFAVALDDFLAFAPREPDDTEQTLRKGSPTRTAEARAALRDGRRLRRAKLIVAEGDQQWSVVLDGPTMSLRSIKLPEDGEDATTPRDKSIDRIASFVTLWEIVGALYRVFLTERLRSDYLTTAAESQAQWMARSEPLPAVRAVSGTHDEELGDETDDIDDADDEAPPWDEDDAAAMA